MTALEPADVHRLNAALGWLGLNCAADARAELAALAPELAAHPTVLEVRWLLCAHERDWAGALGIARAQLAAAPQESAGWLNQAYALRRVTEGGLPQARQVLLPAAAKFPGEPIITYNLACYACQLAHLDEARDWLRLAVKVGGKDAIKKLALGDDDLKPLWAEIGKM
jgi:predicted Zn-dependent protease